MLIGTAPSIIDGDGGVLLLFYFNGSGYLTLRRRRDFVGTAYIDKLLGSAQVGLKAGFAIRPAVKVLHATSQGIAP